MELSEIKKMQVVDMNTGTILGEVIDVDINLPSGNIKSFIISINNQPKLFKRNKLISNGIISIKWEDIKTIGQDVILINTNNK